jgi:hypothetical protein
LGIANACLRRRRASCFLKWHSLDPIVFKKSILPPMAWSIHTTSPIGAPKSKASLAGTNFITSKGAWDAILTAEEQMTSLLPRLRCNPKEAAFISNLVKSSATASKLPPIIPSSM